MDARGHARVASSWRPLAALAALAVLLGACSGLPRGVLVQRQGSSTPGPGSIDAFVPEAVRFVQGHRGLKFKQTVKVRHLADKQFADRVIQLQRQDHADLDRQGKVLRALGLLRPDVDPEKAEEELLGSGVVGFYDPQTKELEVRGTSATLAVKHVVVHELTHALQDQWFTLPTGPGSGNDDADLAYTTLVEGDAVRVESAYVAGLSAEDRQTLQQQESGQGGPPSDVPQVLVELLEFPYLVGPRFTQAVLQAKGQQGLDDAFKNRPASSSQVLHPERFVAGDAPATPPEPAADGTAFDRGTLGEVGVALLLEDLVRSGALTTAQLQAATSGWAGDRYVAWAQGDGYCVRDRLATRTAADAAALQVALRALTAAHSSITVDATSGAPVLTSCG
ncbi:MAG TPA: hypothetical protein VLW53_19820 [Candidatus Eisenbacteria bacterium]|nr:hypothetical protein [Candidatus Eisenbacteria bacterium]